MESVGICRAGTLAVMQAARWARGSHAAVHPTALSELKGSSVEGGVGGREGEGERGHAKPMRNDGGWWREGEAFADRVSYGVPKGKMFGGSKCQVVRRQYQVDIECVESDRVNYVHLIQQCGDKKALADGRSIHAWIVKRYLNVSVFIGNQLMVMYSKCGSILDARQVFDGMNERNAASWNTMIGTYARNNHGMEAFKLFQHMQHKGVKPDKFTFINTLIACTRLEAHALGKVVHAHMIDGGFQQYAVLGNALINMYGKCRRMQDACRVFQDMTARDVFSWSSMISAYALGGYGDEALRLFQEMEQEGVMPNRVTFVNMLNACFGPEALSLGKLVHALIVGKKVESEAGVATAIVNMYAKCRNIIEARRMFEKMPVRNLLSWSTIISAYGQQGDFEEAFQLFENMQQEGMKPNEVTCISILNACASPEALTMGKLLHAYIADVGQESDVSVGNALISMYGKCENIEDARRMFDKMPFRDKFSWNAMISVYSRHGHGEDAFQLLQQMQQEGSKPTEVIFLSILNAYASPEALPLGKLIHAQICEHGFDSGVVIGTALLNMYGRCGNMVEARRMFNNFPEHDLASWNAIISVYAQHGCCEEAFKVFQQMQQESVKPDKITFIEILSSFASPEALSLGKLLHTHIVDRGFESDVIVGTSLVNMYGKCGSIEDARIVFENMVERTVISWSGMIAAYAQNGHGKEAIATFYQMQREGMKPNLVTFISVLQACSHAGLIDEGLRYFKSMSQDHGITPILEHYNCIVDLLGRAGKLEEAEDFIIKMPVRPDATVWMTLLSSCRMHDCTDIAKRAAESALKLDPQLTAAYAVLLSIHSAAGRLNDVEQIKKLMADSDVKREPGCSWIVVHNEVHEFHVNDRSHPQTEKIYAELERLNQQMESSGFVSDTDLVLHDMEDEQSDNSLCYHSEKLAIVFGLISTPSGTTLRIANNLSMCTECHALAQFISKLVGREIVVRDASRFHHFNDGACSCGDYW